MTSLIALRSFGTHDGSFHADEVTACALLLTFGCIDQGLIQRTRDHRILEHLEYVCDVGGLFDPQSKRFDHHQSSYTGALSSAGMVLQYLVSQQIVSAELGSYLKDSLIDGIDAHDNGRVTPQRGHCNFSLVIHNFMPIHHDASDEALDCAFFEAVTFTVGHLRRLIDRFEYIASCKEEVAKAMRENQSFLIFDRSMPWMESFFELGGENHPARFIIMPSRNHWKLRGIPPNYEQRMNVRQMLPASWAGKLSDELANLTKIRGAIFCHKGRFISVWETKKDAIDALSMVLEGVE